MLKNYLTIALRNLLRHKLFSFINILGLAIGMAACLLIMQYVSFELSYDSFHKNKDRIFRIPVDFYLANGQHDYIEPAGPPALGPALKQDFPEVADYVRLHWLYDGNILSYKNKRFVEGRIYHAEPSFLSIFSYPLIKGDARTALNEPNNILLTQSTARKYFGDEEPVGKMIQFNGKQNLMVTGVLQDLPANSHLQLNALISFATYVQQEKDNLNSNGNNWGWFNFFTYILLKPNTDADAFASKLPAFLEKYMGKDMREKNYRSALIFQPLTDVYLNNSAPYEVELKGNRQTVYFLSIIALFVIVIAWVNYVNLSTAKATQRAKEVGIRKVVGSTMPQLIGQFLLESVLMNMIAVAIAFFWLMLHYHSSISLWEKKFLLLSGRIPALPYSVQVFC